jgi:hypothetical protein
MDNIQYGNMIFAFSAGRLVVPNIGCAVYSLRNPVKVIFTLPMGGERRTVEFEAGGCGPCGGEVAKGGISRIFSWPGVAYNK